MLRNATAHLGKIERDLRPTVIVNESDTVLLGSHEKESRRIKRAPKKFDDYDNSNKIVVSDSEAEEPAAKKVRMTLTNVDKAYSGKFKPCIKQTCDELKLVKMELNKMFHVSVDLHRLDHLQYIEPLCMVHDLYKCECKGEGLPLELSMQRPMLIEKSIPLGNNRPLTTQQPSKKQSEPAQSTASSRSASPPSVSNEPEEQLVDDGFSRRVLPIIKRLPHVPTGTQRKAVISSDDGMPKLEILNLTELINGGIGPIFINVYDDKKMRLNPITRSVLNNKSAIVYFDGFGYFVDKTRVNIKKLDFSKVKFELKEPIYIIQRKDDMPPPVSSTMNDDFIKILFTKDSSEIIQIFDKTALTEISEIIESILRNVKRKLASTFAEEPSELVKEQLSMLTRDRSRSRSISSAGSSPLSFKGMKLVKAPEPGIDTERMKNFNEIFSSRMKRLVTMISSNSLGLRPSIEMLNKFYIYKWQLLLQSFEEDLVQIWQVRLESTTDKGFHMLVLTESREVPEVEHAIKKDTVNIRRLSLSDKITELTRLILLRVENSATANMTILFYGCKGYLRMCGILNSKEPYLNGFVAKPSHQTHPKLAAKIQKTYNIWHASQKKKTEKVKRAEKVPTPSQPTTSLLNSPRDLPFPPNILPTIAQKKVRV